MSVGKLAWKAFGSTDIGGGRENQDDFFVWENPERGLVVTGVLDGHGRDVGKVAAMVGTSYLKTFCENNQDLLESNAFDFMVRGITEAHEAIREGFMKALTGKGYEVKQTEEGYLVKRKSSKSQWVCVHGGTSCSVVALVGTQLYTANVGDSTGILSASKPVLHDSMLQFVGDSAELERKTSSMEQASDETTNTLVITSDHSPESPVEFCRMRSFRTRENDPQQPALLVVYDASQQDKSRCPPVFELDSGGVPIVTNRGSYYKNVRREWASLVAAPPYAKFQDALAFTRSIGDFHLHIYGVSEKPEVHCVDLKPILLRLASSGAYTPAKRSAPVSPSKPAANTVASSPGKTGVSPMRLRGERISPMDTDENGKMENSGEGLSVDPTQFPALCVVLASDGIWDNWEYADVSNFVMNPVNAVGGGDGTGVERAVQSSKALIKSNAGHASRNFGDQADNATGVVMFIQPTELSL
eukprot:CAMPEP_0114430314 /NCGR_PEP_ID=MMETSP0103-20121206/9975_1 /TAXON_ID=37642 ORGANISM="Paraphysomonas imperforata, Strain PA2" /NCGR_SAMPLE_ID=MMETSP0103 /ASSEMBLY_ACC=CAM_ASM_000201 /LENGTH=470 /DNA_ID=CAMNT_0001599753 /DNA_START=51 /DNA_END=1463 /DNA_ORIENTATION=-